MKARSTRFRRPLAALLAAAAAGFALMALRPAPPPAARVLVAARDLPAGTAIDPSDVRRVNLPPEAVPSGVLRSPDGRVLAAPMRRGEPLTDARVVGAGLLKGYGPDTVATPVRVADADSVALLRPGDRIDVLAAPAPSGLPDADPFPAQPDARAVASALPVITVPSTDEADPQQGALVVLATTRPQALALTSTTAPLALTITPR